MKRIISTSTTFTLLLATSINYAVPTNANIDKEKQLRRNKKKAERAESRAQHHANEIESAAPLNKSEQHRGKRTKRHKKQKEAELRQYAMPEMTMTQRTGTTLIGSSSTQENAGGVLSKRDQKKLERDSNNKDGDEKNKLVARTNASANNSAADDHPVDNEGINGNAKSREGNDAADSSFVVVDNGSTSSSNNNSNSGNEGSVSKKDVRNQKKAMRNQVSFT